MGEIHELLKIEPNEVIAILLLLIGFTAWLIRLEAKTLNTERYQVQMNVEVKEIRIKHDLVSDKLAESMGYIREALAEIRGRLAMKENKDK